MALSNRERLSAMNNIRLSVFQIPECPFLHVAVAGGIHLPACLQPQMPLIYLLPSSVPFMPGCQDPTGAIHLQTIYTTSTGHFFFFCQAASICAGVSVNCLTTVFISQDVILYPGLSHSVGFLYQVA